MFAMEIMDLRKCSALQIRSSGCSQRVSYQWSRLQLIASDGEGEGAAGRGRSPRAAAGRCR